MKAFYTWNGCNATTDPDPMIPFDASRCEDQFLQPYKPVPSTQQTDIFSFPTEQLDPPSTVLQENDNELEGDDTLDCEEMFSQQLLPDDTVTAFDRTGWAQPTEIQCPVPRRPLMVAPRQVSSGGLLSPGDANTLMPRPWGQTKSAGQTAQSNLASETTMPLFGDHDRYSVANNSDATPPSSPVLPADVARIMSPCQRSQLRRYDRHARQGTWKRQQPPYEAVNADGLYAELCEEVREGRRHQRERDAWLAKYLKGTNTNTATNMGMATGVNTGMNACMNTGGGDTTMQDAVQPVAMPPGPPAPFWFPGLVGPVATYHGYLSMAGDGYWQQPQATAFIPTGQAVWGPQPVLYDFGTTSDMVWTAEVMGANGGFYGE